jgi:S1-C subfamily serine protease
MSDDAPRPEPAGQRWLPPPRPAPPPEGPPAAAPGGHPAGWPRGLGTAPLPASPPPAAPPRRRRPASAAAVAAIAAAVGGLVGAAVAGGLVLAFDDDPPREIVREIVRPAQTIADQGDIQSILAAVEPSVVRIDVSQGFRGQASGTGFVIDPDGVIVTNAHVISGSGAITVTLPDGETERAEVVGADPSRDLAVLQIGRSGLPAVKLGSSSDLRVGDEVVAIGHALGLEGAPTVTTGVVSALDRTIATTQSMQLDDVIQTDAAINRGNSGGPLVNVRGEVVGINTAIADPSYATNIGWAISIDSARPVIDDLRRFGSPRIAYLGVVTDVVTPGVVESNDLAVDEGAIVLEVAPGTPAEDAGIRPGDVILEVDGLRVEGPRDVREGVQRNEPGDEIEIVLQRGSERIELRVKLGLLPTS